LNGRISSIARSAPAASSLIWDNGIFLMVIPRLLSQTRAVAPAAAAATASCSGFAIRTLNSSAGRGGGGASTSSPSSRRASPRPPAPSFLTPGADSAHSGPLTSVGTMKMRAHTASSALTTV
jgi:hypothetical protein